MIGKPEWFKRRKYTGWGIMPKTWQGYVYIAVMILPFLFFHALPYWSTKIRMIVTIVWAVILGIDVIHIMIKMKKDERERMHEAIAERNALWFMLMALVIGIAYETISNAASQKVYVNPFMAAAVIGAVIVKMITNIYLERKN
ncbi:MAG: hypothetical protein V1906_02135 [Candidatus Woesearchaeota archaeon]